MTLVTDLVTRRFETGETARPTLDVSIQELDRLMG